MEVLAFVFLKKKLLTLEASDKTTSLYCFLMYFSGVTFKKEMKATL